MNENGLNVRSLLLAVIASVVPDRVSVAKRDLIDKTTA
jgi:hypothetical protein